MCAIVYILHVVYQSAQRGKRSVVDETEASAELIASQKLDDDDDDLASNDDDQEEVTLHAVSETIKNVPVRPILLHANLTNIKNDIKDESEIEEGI